MILLFVLILDTKTAISGAKSAVDLCISAVIPSLFPFFIISSLITAYASSIPLNILRPISALTHLPKGAEAFLLLGMLGGYPIGAQAICEAYKNKTLSRTSAKRMLGFCSNAGPAFIFGIIGGLFENSIYTWALWLIHIISALIVGMILPVQSNEDYCSRPAAGTTISQAVEKSVKVMAIVCGWIIIFRVILSFFQRWVLWLLPQEIVIWIVSLAELTIGAFALNTIPLSGLRFIIAAGSLGFGGLCVAMQTVSVTRNLGTGCYFPGKILQGCISVFLATIIQFVLFTKSEQYRPAIVFYIIFSALFFLAFMLIFKRNRKNSSNYAHCHV